jgi:alpha-amylase
LRALYRSDGRHPQLPSASSSAPCSPASLPPPRVLTVASPLSQAYFQILAAFGSTNGSISALATVHDQLKSSMKDTSLLGGFTECHDQVRLPSFVSDKTLVANAMAYPFVSDGIPILYYGQEQGFSGGEDPANREPMWTTNYDTTTEGYRFVQTLTAVRSAAGNASSNFLTTQVSPHRPSPRPPALHWR